MLTKLGTVVAVASAIMATTVAPLVPSASASASGASAVACGYSLTTWAGGFSAEVSITNGGPPIDGWAVRWTFDTPTTITAVWRAQITQNSSGVFATNAVYNSRIGTGQTMSFGWSALAPSTTVPTNLSVNGRPC